MPHISIDDLADPRLAVYHELHKSNLTRASGRFIAEGRWLVQRLVASRLSVLSIVCSERHLEQLPAALPADVPVYVLERGLLSRLVGFNFHRGMLACGGRPANVALQTWFSNRQPTSLLAVCPQVVDPTNLGGIIRNCCAFGAAGLLLGPGCADPFCRRVVRVSMGSAFQLPIRQSRELVADLQILREQGHYELVAAVLDPTADPLPSAPGGGRLALLFGSEGHGLERRWTDACDRLVTLPMKQNTDSLNLATATGVFLYHFTAVAAQRVADRPAE